jgi:hypothetical protein
MVFMIARPSLYVTSKFAPDTERSSLAYYQIARRNLKPRTSASELVPFEAKG